MEFEAKYFKTIDWVIILILIGFGIFSYLGISGASPHLSLEGKQVVWYMIGFVFMSAILLFDYNMIGNLSYIFYFIGLVLLVGVLFTPPINNATSWYNLGLFSFQPAELMKIITIMTLAKYLAKRAEQEDPFSKVYELIPIFAIIGVPMLLILIQPDLGNAVVFSGILISMMIVGGVKGRHFFLFGALAGSFFGFLTYLYQFKQEIFFKLIKPYQWNRIVYWLNPELDPVGQGFQLKQSLIAIGSGQLLGKGINAGTQAKFGWVPVGESDFIFTVIAEELGFIGGSLLIFLFFLLIYRMVRIALDAKDPFGSYLVSGVIGMFVFQIFENIGMTIQLMPITGITLPFISYGGSSLVTNFMIIGLVLNVGMRRKKLMFD
ncbi:rod shape-determining protein RodA [Ammoniphilus sp. CFH 90114]|uniref:rod shape-determining protein RodA n=1 Tax=Ammoniphilus sp. CFH 90114 TaxID=2493665 RepID=UPI00100F4448|nr:rod shape-determining protein RodA [Ammoniphilus sp. CFH 90114]RXT14725.1 rod shape-determining protein RodA [Ammoniphilus sp. CFH 90114]